METLFECQLCKQVFSHTSKQVEAKGNLDIYGHKVESAVLETVHYCNQKESERAGVAKFVGIRLRDITVAEVDLFKHK